MKLVTGLPRTVMSFWRTSITARAAVAIGLIIASQSAWSAQDVAVDAQRKGNALAISARATIRAPLSLIWQTLTDYDHLADFIPGMKRSRVLERRGGKAIVEQIGEARFWVFHYPIDVILESNEHYPRTIGVRVLAGNLRQLAGAYRIDTVSGASDEFVLRWQGIIEPDISLPLFITAPGLRGTVTDQFVGMVNEIERRQSSARP